MRGLPGLVAVALGAMVLASGCGQRHDGTPAGPPLTGSTSPSPAPQPGDPGAASCGSAAPPIALITITYADNGRTLCVRRGTAVQVYLTGTPKSRWSAIRASGTALIPHPDGRLMPPIGETGAWFLAVRRGTAVLTSFRMPCGPEQTPPNAGSQSGTLECDVIIAFHATIKVT